MSSQVGIYTKDGNEQTKTTNTNKQTTTTILLATMLSYTAFSI